MTALCNVILGQITS